MIDKVIIAHRGASNHAKENTLDAFKKAVEIGADMIEFDVRRTKDLVLISYNNQVINSHLISDLDYEEIQKYSSLQNFVIPQIEEILKAMSGNIKLFVDLKEEGYENEITDLLLRYCKKEDFIINTFSIKSLRKIRKHSPDIKLGLFIGTIRSKFLLFLISFLSSLPFKILAGFDPDVLSIHFDVLKFKVLELAQKNKKTVMVWVVNEEAMMLEMLNNQNIQGIITDKPDLAISLKKRITSNNSDLK